MKCNNCKSNQTFVLTNKYAENQTSPMVSVKGQIFRAVYFCAHCQKFERVFNIKMDDGGKWLMKVGQYPPWEIKGHAKIEKLLGNHSPIEFLFYMFPTIGTHLYSECRV